MGHVGDCESHFVRAGFYHARLSLRFAWMLCARGRGGASPISVPAQAKLKNGVVIFII
jgi:hypothetical protein